MPNPTDEEYRKYWVHTSNLNWCVLMTTGRTGSDFFQSLLDSHSQVMTFNGVLQFQNFWAGSLTAQYTGTVNISDIADEFIGQYMHRLKSKYDTIERKDGLGEEQNETIDIDPVEFKGHIIRLLNNVEITEQAFLCAIYISYALCLGQNILKKKLILHHIHQINAGVPFMRNMPNAKGIVMTRDPRAAYVSGVDNWRRHNPNASNPGFPLYILHRVVDQALPLLEFEERTRSLRLEDLGNKDILVAVCDWLSIDYEDTMSESTWAGLRWWGDRLSSRTIPDAERGFSQTLITNKWEVRLNAIDKYVLRHALNKRLADYRYEQVPSSSLVAAVCLPAIIFLPTTFEIEHLAQFKAKPKSFGKHLHSLLGGGYHYIRRVAYFFSLYRRNILGTHPGLRLFRPIKHRADNPNT
jgi:hypothetical protein